MSYYGAGDYYGAGGLFDVLKGVGKAAIGGLGGFIKGGPVGGITGVVSSILPTSTPVLKTPAIGPTVINPPFGGPPGAGIGPIGTPAHMATAYDRRFYTKDGTPRRIRKDGRPWKIPSMDPGNAKALTRASRRIDRFVGVARRAMKHTNYKVVSKSAGRGKRK